MSETIEISESELKDLIARQVRSVLREEKKDLSEVDAREMRNAIEGTKFTEDDILSMADRIGGINDIAAISGRADVLAIRGTDGNMYMNMTTTPYVTVHEVPRGMSAREFAEASQTEPGFYGEYPQIGSFEI